jgi:putative oxidoreductase
VPREAGRLMVVALFWWDVVFLLIPDFAGTVSYISQRGLPFPNILAIAVIVALLVLPAMLFFRKTEALGFIGLSLFCILTAVLFHQYWKLEGFERTMEQIHFMKNIALAGAMLMLTAQAIQRERDH